MRRLNNISRVFIFVAGLLGTCVFAAESNSAVTDTSGITYILEEIVVLGNQSGLPRPDISTLTESEIAAKQAVTTADIFRLDPALNVTSGVKSETETRLRGFSPAQLLVLIDGRPINPGYYGKVDLAMLPVDNIAKIIVVKGPASVAFGPNSMGGVVNIITKNGRETPRTVLTTEFGDYSFRQLSLNHSRTIGKWNYWLSGYENYSDGFLLSEDFHQTSLEGGGLRDNSGYHKTGGDVKLGYETSRADVYALNLGYHWAKKDVPTTIYSWDSPTYRRFPSYIRFNSSLSGNKKLSQNAELKSVVYLDAYHDRLIDYRGPEMLESQQIWDSKVENWTVGGSVDGALAHGRFHKLRSGLMLKRDLMNKQPDTGDPWKTYYQSIGNLYLEDNISINSKTGLTGGIGYAARGEESIELSDGELTPSLLASRTLPGQIQLQGSYAHAIHFPTLHELFSETSGNPALMPEKADKWEASLSRNFRCENSERSLLLQASYFYSDLHNLIYRGGRNDVYNNLSQTKLEGWEINADASVSRFFEVSAGYVRIEPRGTSRVMLEELSPNRLHASITAKTSFGFSAIYDLNTFDNRKTPVAGFTLYPYELHQLVLSQEIGKHVTVHLKAQNLTDVDYQEELGYPGAGRQISGGLRYEL
jgi:outer membrane cobalamin receptor